MNSNSWAPGLCSDSKLQPLLLRSPIPNSEKVQIDVYAQQHGERDAAGFPGINARVWSYVILYICIFFVVVVVHL